MNENDDGLSDALSDDKEHVFSELFNYYFF